MNKVGIDELNLVIVENGDNRREYGHLRVDVVDLPWLQLFIVRLYNMNCT
jgi:hypothetical protein